MVLPVALTLSVYEGWFGFRLYHMSEDESRVAWGGLRGTVFYAWVLTFLLSSFGCTSSFVMFALLDTPEGTSTFLYVVMHLTYIVCVYAILHGKKHVVLACLCTNVFVYVVLFVYTVVVFDAAPHTWTLGFLVWTHFCNFTAILHVYVMDLMYWYPGWTDAREAYRSSIDVY